MACASCSVIAGCALVGVAKAANKPKLIRIDRTVRFIVPSTSGLAQFGENLCASPNHDKREEHTRQHLCHGWAKFTAGQLGEFIEANQTNYESAKWRVHDIASTCAATVKEKHHAEFHLARPTDGRSGYQRLCPAGLSGLTHFSIVPKTKNVTEPRSSSGDRAAK